MPPPDGGVPGSMWRDLLDAVGIDGANTVAGFGGGLVNVFRNRGLVPFQVVGTLISGALIANYLGKPLAELIHFPVVPTSFVIGFMGVQTLDYVVSLLKGRAGGAQDGGGRKDASA